MIPRKKRLKRGKPPKKVKAGTLKNKLDAAFSAMIRARDEHLWCVSCRQMRTNMQAGHFMDRRHLSTRWHPQNVNGQCAHCNCWLHGNLLEYADELVLRYGVDTDKKLRELARMSWKPSREALEQLLAAAKLGHEQYLETWEFYGAKL